MEYFAYYLGSNSLSQNSFDSNNIYLDQVLPTWLQLKEDGSLLKHISNTDLKLFNKYNFSSHISPLLQNYNLSSKVTNSFLKNKESREKGINNIINFLEQSSYNKINIDLEGVDKTNKINYLKFIGKLANNMSKYDYKLGISIPAKTENHVDTGWAGAYDYEKLGVLVDKVMIMAYDYHWAGGPAGPIAPLPWVYDVIDYVIMQVPLEKIFIGIPCYGYDWVIDNDSKRAKGLSYQQIIRLKEKHASTIEWDQESETPYLCYKDSKGQHEVWFENTNSISKKVEMIRKFQIRGAVFWRLGLGPSDLWKELSKK